jgi:NAD(P)-dependent dehydrogenase (short-subunit alcohol dehydrogenase family)
LVLRAKEDGWSVVVLDQALEPSGHRADEWITVDIRNRDAMHRAVSTVSRGWGKADGLIVTAGIADPATAMDIPGERAQEVMDVNVTATIRSMPLLAGVLGDRAAVVLFSSVAAMRGGGFFGGSTYAASKSAVEGFTRGLARDLAHRGIRVNCIAPGPTRTPMLMAAPDDVLRRVENATLLGRLGEPAEVAAVAMFLVGPDSSFMTGAVLHVDGGAALK